MTGPRRAPLAGIALLLAGALTSTGARADRKPQRQALAPPGQQTKAICVQEHDRAQAASIDHKLRSAREHFQACAADVCPAIVREDCLRSLAELEPVIPTLVFVATSDQGDVTDVRVLVDGAVVAEQIDGRAHEIDPGPHVVRFERAGSAPIELTVVARDGDKNRPVTATYASPLTRQGASAALAEVPPERDRGRGKRFPILPVTIAGVGLAAIGGGAYMRLSADADAEHLQSTCAPRCEPGVRDELSDRIVMSNVSLGVGLGALGLSALLWVLQR